MAEMKFSCAQCGQHISCDELWSGHQIQCPACKSNLTVPDVPQAPAAGAPALPPSIAQASAPSRPKLSAGATQVTRPTPSMTTPHRQLAARPRRTGSPLLRYAIIAVVLAAVGGVAYTYMPALLRQAQEIGGSKTPGSATAPVSGGAGPLGEVNGAMDVSDAMEGGSSATPRPAAAKQPVVVEPALATNAAAKTSHGTR